MHRRLGRGGRKDPAELSITAFLNLMVVLVPFLLITAVFSQITILQLNLPAPAASDGVQKKELRVEVVIRENSIELGDGTRLIKRMNNTEDGYDVRELSKLLLAIKANHPEKKDATILLEPDIQYDVLVKTMDAVGSAEVFQAGAVERVELFPQISIGDAPIEQKKKAKRKG